MAAIVDTADEAATLDRPPLLIREPLERLLDAHGLGHGPISARTIGEGHSNVTFLIERGDVELVLRRPPRPPYHPRAHDVVREARIMAGLATTDVPVPAVLLIHEDDDVLGVPFYVMDRVHGEVITTRVPDRLRTPDHRRTIVERLVDGLVAISSVDVERSQLSGLTPDPSAYLERRVAGMRRVLESGRVRDTPVLDRVGRMLWESLPEQRHVALVHGDYRLGNVMLEATPPPRLAAILDWEVAALGDPLIDVGWLLTTHPEVGDAEGTLISMAAGIVGPGLPTRRELLARYVAATGVTTEDLRWYLAYSYWRGAVGLEGFYARALQGTTDDPFIHALREGVPELADRALDTLQTTDTWWC